MVTLVHLVYIHGFQGDDTTFQSFPKDLQEHISALKPPHPHITFQSSIYPTYKCVKPLSYATKNFLEWLTTQPPGPVILLAHSMGGLLAAEAATDLSNNIDRHSGAKPKRIIGLIAFDTPYLGLHPHVVISGLASLLPKGEEGNEETTKSMNDHPKVNIVDDKVTDDWEAFKKQAHVHYSSINPQPLRSHSPSPSSHSQIFQGVLNIFAGYADRPLVRWLNKHADDPLSAGKRWFVERYQFGVAMFDPSSLSARYRLLVGWQGGKWVNYWTRTTPKSNQPSSGFLPRCDDHPPDFRRTSAESMNNDQALVVNGLVEESAKKKAGNSSLIEQKEGKPSTSAKTDNPAYKKESKPRGGHHFTVLPKGLGERFGGMERWEQVDIEGVEDEVGAHLGLFMAGQNLAYHAFVERVGKKIFEWCQDLHPDN